MRWPRARSFDHRTRVRRGRGWRVFSFSVASLWDAGHGFDPILAHPALSPPTPQRLPTAEENRWFSEEVHVHEPSLRAYLRTQYPFAPDIDDVVQESFLRLWKVRMGQPVRYAKALLFKVARHLVIDSARRNQISPIDHVTDLAALRVIDDERPGPAEAACKHEEVVLLAAAIDSLPARCREILILRKLRGVPQKAIAAQLGLSEQTVQVQVSRGVRRCEEFLRAHGVQP